MARKGTPSDNAPIESFRSLLKSKAFYMRLEQKQSHVEKCGNNDWIFSFIPVSSNRDSQKLHHLVEQSTNFSPIRLLFAD